MDWYKIKTVIIIDLVIMNLIIGYIFFQKNKYKLESIKNKQNAIKMLENNGVEIDIDKKIIKNFESVKVQYINMKKIFENKDFNTEKTTKYLLSAIKNDIGFNINEFTNTNSTTLNPIEKYNIQVFFDENIKIDLNLDNYEILKVEQVFNQNYDRELKKVNIIQSFDDYFLDGAFINLILYKNKVISIKMKWCNIEYSKLEKIETISFEKVLYKLLREIKKQNIKKIYIKNLKRGYTFNKFNYNSELVEGEVLPMYRFITNENKIFDIKAM